MTFSALRSQLREIKAKLPPPPGKPPVMIFARKYDPENPPAVDLNSWEPDPDNPGKSRHPLPYDGVETPTHWTYKNAAELVGLRERFDRFYGPATRGPNDPPCLFVRLTDAAEIFEEQFKGGPYEHLWLGGPESDGGVAS